MPLNSVHLGDGSLARFAVVPRLHKLRNEHRRVVVALLASALEFARAGQQPRHARAGVSVKQGHFERAGDVERKFVSHQQVHDALVVAEGVEASQLAANRRVAEHTEDFSVNGRPHRFGGFRENYENQAETD